MDKIIIQGGKSLAGEVTVSGAKNAALPVLVSALLTGESCTYKAIPHLADIRTTLKLLSGLGIKVEQRRWLEGSDELSLQADAVNKFEAPYDLVKTMR
ncbi:MAG TPA: UDP-N-acetylglucosamine 1-carboxyvinyltransferase, partial [Pseudolabrys sp.]|nr:UDP-N-acetylglucosamine 1-carboxyvinyltransferase [Pseudolabrys sp.]